MKINEGLEQEYAEYCEKNSHDSYSNGVITYTERWADLMEKALEEGKTIPEVAEALSHEADTEGITGFMYGCACSALAEYWVHGEVLRKWHNREYDYDGDGVVNPAILHIKVEGDEG